MSQSGTSVDMDFVEAPSQLLENYAWNKDVLEIFAKHHVTGEVMPDSLLNKMILARNFQSANDALQQIFYGIYDLSLNFLIYDSFINKIIIGIKDISQLNDFLKRIKIVKKNFINVKFYKKFYLSEKIFEKKGF